MAELEPPPLSPLWWVRRLHKKLTERAELIAWYDRYYRGEHPLPWLPAQARDEFRRILRMTRSNYMGLVVDAKAERMQVEGFRVGDSEKADKDLWRIWQENDLDSDHDQAVTEALIGGVTYMLVAPNPRDRQTPIITVEHASQAIVEHVPGSGRRMGAAGLKVWLDDWTGLTMATLYLPDRLYKFQATTPNVVAGDTTVRQTLRWVPRATEETVDAPNPLKIVPLVELPNRPRLLTGGVSELHDLTDIQDRINKTIADRLITQDFGAFPQKWATGYPEEDADGNPVAPMDVGRDRLVSTDVEGARFGQWDAAPLDPYSAAKREDVKDIASRSRTPAQYLLGEISNVNGETLKAAESGLISTVRRACRSIGEGTERAMKVAQIAAGLEVAPQLETIWRNPEFRTEGEITDAAVKKLQARIASLRQAREDVGYSQTQIARLEQDDTAEMARAGLGDLGSLFGPKPTAPPTPPPFSDTTNPA